MRSRICRSLTQQEQTLVEWLIANGSPEAQKYSSQVPELRVTGCCGCGCPTVDFAIGDKTASTGASSLLADFLGVTPEGINVGVILHGREGGISELEVYPIDETDGKISLPKIDSLRPV